MPEALGGDQRMTHCWCCGVENTGSPTCTDGISTAIEFACLRHRTSVCSKARTPRDGSVKSRIPNDADDRGAGWAPPVESAAGACLSEIDVTGRGPGKRPRPGADMAVEALGVRKGRRGLGGPPEPNSQHSSPLVLSPASTSSALPAARRCALRRPSPGPRLRHLLLWTPSLAPL